MKEKQWDKVNIETQTQKNISLSFFDLSVIFMIWVVWKFFKHFRPNTKIQKKLFSSIFLNQSAQQERNYVAIIIFVSMPVCVCFFATNLLKAMNSIIDLNTHD